MTDKPNWTEVPNALMELMPYLPDAECRVMLVIARKTHGYHKACDVISISQLVTATGMVKQGVINGINAAIKRGILKRTSSGFNNGYCYEILADQVVHEVDHLKQSTKQTTERSSSPRSRPLVVHEVDHLGAPSSPRSRPTKEKTLKEKERKISRADRAPPSEHQRLMELYANALPDRRITNGGAEGAAAKKILAAGYTPEQAIKVYEYLKQREFYADQHVSLQTVNKQMGAVLEAIKRGSNGLGSNQTAGGRMVQRNGHRPANADIPTRPASSGQAEYERQYLDWANSDDETEFVFRRSDV